MKIIFFALILTSGMKLAAQEELYDLPPDKREIRIFQPENDKNDIEYMIIDGVLTEKGIKQRDILKTVILKDKKNLACMGIDTSKNVKQIEHLTIQNEDWIYDRLKNKPTGVGQTPIVIDGVFKDAYYDRKKSADDLDTADVASVRFLNAAAARKKYSSKIVYGAIEVTTRPKKTKKPKPIKIEPMY